MDTRIIPQITGPGAAPMRAAAPTPVDGDAARTARDFEATFLSQAVDQMLQSGGTGMFGGGHAEETWRSFLSNAVAEAVADQGSTGIAQSVEQAIRAYGQGGTS